MSLGHFLYSDEGRLFVIQVPGVATSTLPDDQLAELMNWLLVTYSANELPDSFEPFTAAEIGDGRASPEMDVVNRREAVLRDISAAYPDLASTLQRDY